MVWSDQLHKGGINEIHLYSGAGGGILGGMLLGHRPICAVESDLYCRKVLQARMRDGILPRMPIFPDARLFDGLQWQGTTGIVCGGFPCQPWSTAGKQKGETDERNLWPDTFRIIREVGCGIAFLENVPGLLRHDYFGTIIGNLAGIGWDAEWEVISASAMGAPHRRNRLWILCWDSTRLEELRRRFDRTMYAANSKCVGIQQRTADNETNQSIRHCRSDTNVGQQESNRGEVPKTNAGNGNGIERSRSGQHQKAGFEESGNIGTGRGWWETEPELGRVVDGVAHRYDRLTAIGNGQVPIVAAVAFLVLAGRAGIIPEREDWKTWRRRLRANGVRGCTDK